MINKETGSRLKQQFVDASTGEVVPRSQTAKGYEFSKGQYVVLSDDEYQALLEVGGHAIELAEFVPVDAVSPVSLDKSYYLGTDRGSEHAYHLLRAAMQETGLVGIAQYRARGREYLVMLRPHEDRALLMQQLRYQEEIRPLEEIPIAEAAPPSDEELTLAVELIEQRAHQDFDAGQYEDQVKQRIHALIEEKIQGKEIAVAPEAAPMAQVIDLMEALKKSLGEKASPPANEPATPERKPAKRAGSQAKKKKQATKH